MPVTTFICTTVNGEVFKVEAETYVRYYDNVADFFSGGEIVMTLDRLESIREVEE